MDKYSAKTVNGKNVLGTLANQIYINDDGNLSQIPFILEENSIVFVKVLADSLKRVDEDGKTK